MPNVTSILGNVFAHSPDSVGVSSPGDSPGPVLPQNAEGKKRRGNSTMAFGYPKVPSLFEITVENVAKCLDLEVEKVAVDSVPATSNTTTSSSAVNYDLSDVEQKLNFVYLTKKKRSPGTLWFDTGCRRCVAGVDEHRRMRTALSLHGLQPVRLHCDDSFNLDTW